MKTLDDLSAMKALDPKGVLESTAKFADQCQQAWDESSSIKFPDLYKQIYNIVVCGMGGSRFTPKTIKELFRDRIKEPYEIVEDYTLPSYVDRDTLVVLSSFSGTTEEVISCAHDAKKRGAKITAVVQGGQIGDLVKAEGIPAYIFDPKHNPCGQPRIGGGYLLMGHMGLLYALDLIELSEAEVAEAIDYVRTMSKLYTVDISTEKNPAKQLALRLKDTHPFIITAEFLKGFGNAFANQINETAKMISDYRYIPELNHHLMEGLSHPDTLHTNGLFVFFESPLYSERIRRRFAITKEVVTKQRIAVHTHTLSGTTRLAAMLEAYTLSGFTTYYLAMLYDTDPVAIPWVTYFKKELAT